MFGARGPATPCQPVLVKVLCAAAYASKYEGAPRPTPQPDLACGNPPSTTPTFGLNHINKVNLYPNNNNFIQALLVLLVTNRTSDDNDNMTSDDNDNRTSDDNDNDCTMAPCGEIDRVTYIDPPWLARRTLTRTCSGRTRIVSISHS